MCIKSFSTVLDESLRKNNKKKREHKLNAMGALPSSGTPIMQMLVCLMSQGLLETVLFFFFFFSIFLYSVVRQWFPPVCLPGHLSVLLSEFFCCRLLPLYCSSLFFSSLCSFSCVPLFATLWTVEPQAPLSMGFSKAEYWSGLPYPPPGDLLDPGVPSSSLGSFYLGSPIKPVFYFLSVKK